MSASTWRAAALAAALVLPATAAATSTALPAGPVTLPRDLVAPDDPAERGLRLFAAGFGGRTRLDYSEVDGRLAARGLNVGFARRTSENLTVALSIGTLMGSSFDGVGEDEDLGSSLLAQGAATWLVLEGYDEDPFVTATFGLTHLRTRTPGRRLLLTDLSLGVAIGKSFGEVFAPYLAAKAFAGPSTWTWEGDRVNGHDANRWAAAVGCVAAFENGVDVQLEVAPVGARSLTVSVGGWW